jgi:hypothetical protein
MKKLSGLGIFILTVISCNTGNSLEGKWQYAGGIYNGKKEGGTEGYQLQRTYTGKQFDAYMLEEGAEPQKYQSGNYEVKDDRYKETETFSAQPSKLTNVAVDYQYQIQNDTLILRGKLPTGMQVEEYWTKMK